MMKCSYADEYKAIQPPRCNGGKPCKACKAKWEAEMVRRSTQARQDARGIKR
jgi:hypothetical protein